MNSSLARVATASGLGIAAVGLLRLLDLSGAAPFVHPFFEAEAQMASWVAISAMLAGITLALTQPLRQHAWLRRLTAALGIAIMAAALFSLATHILGLASSPFHVTHPFGAVVSYAAGAGVLTMSIERYRHWSAVPGLGILALFTGLLPVFINRAEFSIVPQVSTAAMVTTFLCGIGLLAAAGPSAWPYREFRGPGARAVLLRWFVPTILLLTVLTRFAGARRLAGLPPALAAVIDSVLSMAVVATVVWFVGSRLGAQLDAAAAALRVSEEKFRRLFGNVPAGVAVSDVPDGRLREVNDEFLRIFGYERAELIGRTSAELGLWADHSDRERLLQTIHTGGGEARSVQVRLKHRDGRRLRIRGAAQLVEVQGERLMISAMVDETERLDVREQFRQVFEGVSDVVITLANDGTITAVNSAWEKATGIAATAWIGRKFVDNLHPDDVKRARKELRLALAGRLPAHLPPLRIRTGEDEYRCGEVVTVAPWRVGGEAAGVFVIGRDVSERVQLEEELRHSQKMEAVGKLAGGIAHDFNNLLTVIIGSGRLALETMRKGTPERREVEGMVAAGERAAELTRQLLAFSRRQVLDARDVDLNVLVANSSRMLQRMIGARIMVAEQLAPDAGIVHADPNRIEQVLINLCVNARDAMPEGGTLVLETRNQDVDAAFAAQHPGATVGAYVVLVVSDTGTGMTPQVRARAFEPFFTTKDVGQGTGLGLSSVLGTVQQSGGFILLETEPRRGTAFRIYLPRVRERTPESNDGGVRRESVTVLVVEDDAAVRHVATATLERAGYYVLEAESAEDAVRVWEHSGVVRLLITDVDMPGGENGNWLAARLRTEDHHLNVVFTSGYADARSRGVGLGAHDYFLPKPYDPQQLLEVAAHALQTLQPR